MKKNVARLLRNRKRKLDRRLARKQYENQPRPMFSAGNIHYELADRTQAIGCGGLGAIHMMCRNIGLVDELDERVDLLKRHLPYHESDHVLNLCYNVLVGHHRLEDIELLRNDTTYMDALGAQRIPDPTTAGDFTRRFSRADIDALQDAINATRQRVWRDRLRKGLGYAVIDVDGTMAPTTGECKAGMDISYKGIWGYAPLIVSLANTGEPLYLVNRPGNRPSHDGAALYMDRAATLVQPHAKQVCLRGDTDFSLTRHFDRWTGRGVHFAFGMDAQPALVTRAEEVPDAQWKRLKRPIKHEAATQARERPENVKQRIVEQRNYKNYTLGWEDVAELPYRPTRCKETYRLIMLRKTIHVQEGQARLFDEMRYFFYITNRRDLTAEEVVLFCNGRCNQENVIEQLKNGVNALRLPVSDLLSNWAYMVIAALAWSLKAWFAMFIGDAKTRDEVLRMEYRRFLETFILLPCQIVRTGRKIVYRLLTYNRRLGVFLRTFERIRGHPAT